jgi:ribosome-associated protein
MAKCGPRVTATAQDTRSQARNREIALERLQKRIERALVVPRARKRTKPGKGAVERRLNEKRLRAERKRDRRRPGSEG